MNRKLTNIHIRMNWSRLGEYVAPKKRLRRQFNRRVFTRDVIPAIKRAMRAKKPIQLDRSSDGGDEA